MRCTSFSPSVGLAAGSQRLGIALSRPWYSTAGSVEDEVRQHLCGPDAPDLCPWARRRFGRAGVSEYGPFDRRPGVAHGDAANGSGEMVGRVARLVRYLGEETDVHTEKKLWRSCLFIRSSPARHRRLEGPLNDMAVRWRLAEPSRGRTVYPSSSTWSGSNPVCSPASCWTRFARRAVTTSRPPSYGHQESNQAEETGMKHAHPVLLCCVAALLSITRGEDGWAGSSPRRTTGSGPLLLP